MKKVTLNKIYIEGQLIIREYDDNGIVDYSVGDIDNSNKYNNFSEYYLYNGESNILIPESLDPSFTTYSTNTGIIFAYNETIINIYDLLIEDVEGNNIDNTLTTYNSNSLSLNSENEIGTYKLHLYVNNDNSTYVVNIPKYKKDDKYYGIVEYVPLIEDDYGYGEFEDIATSTYTFPLKNKYTFKSNNIDNIEIYVDGVKRDMFIHQSQCTLIFDDVNSSKYINVSINVKENKENIIILEVY